MAKKPETGADGPDYASMSIDELEELVGELTAILQGKKDARRAELMAELEKLGGVPRAPRGLAPDRQRQSPKPAYRTPDGSFEWSGRGGIPKAFKDLGVTDKGQMEKYRIP